MMMKPALAGVLSFAAVCLPLAAHASDAPAPANTDTIVAEELDITGATETGPALALYRPDVFRTIDGSVLMHSLPVLTLLDGRRFPISSDLGRMGFGLLDLFPVAFLSAVDVQRFGGSPRYGTDAPGGIVDLRLNRDYTGGEVGVFYGKSGGKYGREDFQAYILGGAGNDKFHITVGAAYQESSGRIPAPRR
jgi:iron complex outermembrane receptor protein